MKKQSMQKGNKPTSPQKGYQETISVSYTSGPLPPPEILQQYEETQPGAAKIIIQQWQDQTNNRMKLEQRHLKYKNIIEIIGLIFGFIVALAAYALSGWLIYSNHDTAGVLVGGANTVALVTTFIYGKRRDFRWLSHVRQKEHPNE